MYPQHVSQRSSDDEELGARSPLVLEVSDEECLRDRVPYVTTGELGKDKDSQNISRVQHGNSQALC